MSAAPHVNYVAGLLFNPQRTALALVRKNRPAWQAGKLNAIGGKIEPHETAEAAMVREFAEETGVTIHDWQPVAILAGAGFAVHFFAAFDLRLADCLTTEDEEILRFMTSAALSNEDLIPNLRVIIPLALDETGIVKPVLLADSRPVAA